jgi:hypothetical protein
MSCGTAGATTTISNAGQALLLRICPTYTGSIAVATDYSGEFGLFGVKVITESFIARNAPMVSSLQSFDLESVGNSLIADTLQAIQNITLPTLSSAPVVYINSLGPVISQVNLTSWNGPGNVTIAQTWIDSLDSTTFRPTTLDNLSITQNRKLGNIDLALLNGSITNLVITQNGAMPILNLPNLEAVEQSLAITQVSMLNLDTLQSTGDLSIGSSSISQLNLPKLSNTHTLAINNNFNLTTISVPALETLSSDTANASSATLTIANNNILTGSVTLPVLTTVRGGASISGNYYSISLPQLSSFTDTMMLQSTQDINSTCMYFSSLTTSATNDKLVPSISCIYPGMPVAKPPHQLSKTVIVALVAVAAFILLSGIAAVILFTMVWSSRKKRRAQVNELRKRKARHSLQARREKNRARRWPGYGEQANANAGGFF